MLLPRSSREKHAFARQVPPPPHGLTLVEAMILVVVLAIVSLGFGIALQSNVRIPEAADQRLAIHTCLVAKMEDLLSLDYATLAANNGLSDTVTVNGRSLARTVTTACADADGSNGTDSDFLEVTVTIATQSLKTRVTQP
jgi:Tfp pilus assembly protein PilV